MHLADIESAITTAHASVSKALMRLAAVKATIAEEDHKVSVVKELEKNNLVVGMAVRIEELEAQLAKKGK